MPCNAPPEYSKNLAQFTPGEIALLTGLPAAQQRVWRSRGLLPSVAGAHARFSALEAAELLVRYLLSLEGISSTEAAELGKSAAPMLIYHALLGADGACEILGPKEGVESFLSAFRDDTALAMELAEATEVSRFLWRADGDAFGFSDRVADPNEEGRHLTLFVLDLDVAGRLLCDRAGRPLISVELPLTAPGPRVRKLTHP